MEHFRVIHRCMHKGITKLRKGYYVIIYLRHASKLDNEAKTLRNHTCQLDRSMRVQGSMHMKQRMCQKSNFDSFINIILIIIALKCAINQFKICHIAWLHGRNQNSVYFMMVRLEISGISSSCKVTQHKAIK